VSLALVVDGPPAEGFDYAGVYVPPDNIFPKHFHNIGIRIEVSEAVSPALLSADYPAM
jgi:hypothetical protein